MLRTIALALSLALACLGAEPGGMRPRPAPSDYSVQASTQDGLTIAAAVLSQEEVRNTFATDLNRGWIVVEVAVYPSKN